MSANPVTIRWASRVRPEPIARLYAMDALGVHDSDLIDEVASRLAARCQSILDVTDAMGGVVVCPGCRQGIPHDGRPESPLACPGCSWRSTWGQYAKTFRGKNLYAGAARQVFGDFLTHLAAARTPAARMIAIDQLLHTFHHQLTEYPTAPAAKNLLFGNVQEIVEFLNGLTYGHGTTPEVRQTKTLYDQTLARSWAGGVPPELWRERWRQARKVRAEGGAQEEDSA